MPEKRIKCVECGSTFAISEAEQQYFTSKGFVEPKRCNLCRTRRRSLRMSQSESAIYRPHDSGRTRNHDRANNGAGGTEAQVQVRYYNVKCFSCGTDTRVNYRPSYSNPALCPGCDQGRYRKRRY